MKVVLQNVVLRFADIFNAVEFKKGDGKPRFSASFLIEKGSENDRLINAAITEVMTEAWKDKAPAKIKMFMGQKQQCFYRDGDTLDYDGCGGKMFVAAHRNKFDKKGGLNAVPKIVDRAKQPLTVESGKPYPGCTVNAIIDIWPQVDENPGIRATLNVVQFVADGEPFAGNTPSTDDLPDLDNDIDDADDLV